MAKSSKIHADIQWIAAVYDLVEGTGKLRNHVGVPKSGEAKLNEMINELSGTDRLVALYVPETTDDAYDVETKRGKIVGLAKVMRLKRGTSIEHDAYPYWDGSPKWPIGFPCKIVYSPNPMNCPTLREFVERVHGAGTFGGYVKRIHLGPTRLEDNLKRIFDAEFAQHDSLSVK